ncbi:MAG: hypothetical protein ACXVFM_20100, partial [Solirubrobacteraceae bacterium]
MSEYALRAATADDAEAMVTVTVEGFSGYRSFAPTGWVPPSGSEELERLSRLLDDDDVYYQVAEHEGELVG